MDLPSYTHIIRNGKCNRCHAYYTLGSWIYFLINSRAASYAWHWSHRRLVSCSFYTTNYYIHCYVRSSDFSLLSFICPQIVSGHNAAQTSFNIFSFWYYFKHVFEIAYHFTTPAFVRLKFVQTLIHINLYAKRPNKCFNLHDVVCMKKKNKN